MRLNCRSVCLRLLIFYSSQNLLARHIQYTLTFLCSNYPPHTWVFDSLNSLDGDAGKSVDTLSSKGMEVKKIENLASEVNL
ncbi:hypothetical protein H5410_031595 [Solanum commersonii]|uniref:Uncharacterized protein n=1 Tax=Solanum commersonii TaxID=4109 RepID=A0A9J5YIT0_SOLCO|nr:hypothetical protein H5410_031595 [Solanum commersonii]